MHIGGWSRIGIVLSVLYGILVASVAYESRPRLEYKQSVWFDDAADAISEVLTKTEGQEVQSLQIRGALLNGTDTENVAWLENVAVSPTENQKKFAAQVARVNEKHKAIITALQSEQTKHWLLSLVWWVGGVMLLFGASLSTRWVYRGFRPPSA